METYKINELAKIFDVAKATIKDLVEKGTLSSNIENGVIKIDATGLAELSFLQFVSTLDKELLQVFKKILTNYYLKSLAEEDNRDKRATMYFDIEKEYSPLVEAIKSSNQNLPNEVINYLKLSLEAAEITSNAGTLKQRKEFCEDWRVHIPKGSEYQRIDQIFKRQELRKNGEKIDINSYGTYADDLFQDLIPIIDMSEESDAKFLKNNPNLVEDWKEKLEFHDDALALVYADLGRKHYVL